jgi:hypothetical protein
MRVYTAFKIQNKRLAPETHPFLGTTNMRRPARPFFARIKETATA